MTRKNSPKKGQVVLICPCVFMCEKKYRLCTSTDVCVNPVQNGKKISFCICVSDKNTYNLATYIHLSI